MLQAENSDSHGYSKIDSLFEQISDNLSDLAITNELMRNDSVVLNLNCLDLLLFNFSNASKTSFLSFQFMSTFSECPHSDQYS